jgi:hypothetical protein
MIDDLESFYNKGYPLPSSYDGDLTTKLGEPLRSGHLIYVTIPGHGVKYFKSAVNIHWACVVFTALCGALGRAHLLSDRRFEWDVI